MSTMPKTQLQRFTLLPTNVQLIGARALPASSPVDFVLSQPGRDYEIAEVDPARWGDGWRLSRPRSRTLAWAPMVPRHRPAPIVGPAPTVAPRRAARRPPTARAVDPSPAGDPTERISVAGAA